MLLSGENGHHFNEDRQSLVLFNSIARWRALRSVSHSLICLGSCCTCNRMIGSL
jgi:hypothetical protein